MTSRLQRLCVVALFVVPAAGAAHAQSPTGVPQKSSMLVDASDPGVATAKQAAMGLKLWLTRSAALMDSADYAFKPTADVRSFGQLMAHVADKNYEFCSAALGVERPVRNLEKTRQQRAEIQQALAESFAFCETAYMGLTTAKANALVAFNGRPTPALSILLFLTMHNSLHYGNAITYLRLRGKVPPSTALAPRSGPSGTWLA
jgi:uncharacterized damage-inducible protein DinB